MRKFLNLLLEVFFNIKSLLKIAIYKFIGYKKIENFNTSATPEIADKLIPIINDIEISGRKSPFYTLVYSFILIIFFASLIM